MLNSAANK